MEVEQAAEQAILILLYTLTNGRLVCLNTKKLLKNKTAEIVVSNWKRIKISQRFYLKNEYHSVFTQSWKYNIYL